ncbi:DUF3313 domain-containing protein [Pseudomonas sp. FFUP_PS_473]|jgi:hypothetical protein|uniref:DUF3313 domain-containing protein n=1 Tax=unclassified Pseudomonas TaxID=196821 RepID=UPI000C7AA63A|nr:DUF3313 domain-containing protein [Pseudomonas sp. FFUP_PS_473]MEE3634431.1 DUF3313 domain-containing protein [Pseudomonas sp. AL 58]PLP95095.1 DUF3313 domain-containing protein [Pseudomonas sp. FFUP_PS_473]WJM95057.1 DUF3313 domain-containing protein [Pseudomonas defluvii]
MKRALIVGTLCLSGLVLSGCSSKVVEPEQYSGFLRDYSRLTENTSPSGATVMRWVDPDLKVGRYTSVYIEPSQFYPKPQATERIPQSTLQGITRYYDAALKREISKSMPLAKGPGPGTIVVRPAITAVSSKTEGLKPYEVIPIALVAAAVSTASGIRDQETEIATEAAFLDGGNNKVLAQVVRKGSGKPLENEKQVLVPDDVKVVLDTWASDMNLSFQKLKSH